MNLDLTGDRLYIHVAEEFEGRPVTHVGSDGSKGVWIACDDGFDFYIDGWHILRLNGAGDVFRSSPQSDQWRLEAFIGVREDGVAC